VQTEIILLERVKNLGKLGDQCYARRGYAHFLMREGKALRANKENKAYFDLKRADLEKSSLRLYEKAQEQEKALKDFMPYFIRSAGNTGQLYGSISAKDIFKAVADHKVEGVQASMVVLSRSIKTVGVHRFYLRLHPDIELEMYCVVAKTAPEAATLEKEFKNGMAGNGASKKEETGAKSSVSETNLKVRPQEPSAPQTEEGENSVS